MSPLNLRVAPFYLRAILFVMPQYPRAKTTSPNLRVAPFYLRAILIIIHQYTRLKTTSPNLRVALFYLRAILFARLRQLKNIAWTQRQIGIWQAAGERKFEPVGRYNHSPGCSRTAAEPWVKRRTYQNPERSERVAESAAKTLSQSLPSPGSRPSVSAEAPPRQDAVAGCHPLRYAPGFRLFFFQTQSSAANAAPLWAMVIPPSGLKLTLRKLLCKFQFIELRTQTLGHVWSLRFLRTNTSEN